MEEREIIVSESTLIGLAMEVGKLEMVRSLLEAKCPTDILAKALEEEYEECECVKEATVGDFLRELADAIEN